MISRKRSVAHAFGSSEGQSTAKVVNFPESSAPYSERSKTPATSKPNIRQRATSLLAVRQHLPIWNHADEIRAKIRAHDVLLLVGETGSGKSTQVPQFLVNESWCRPQKLEDGRKIGGCIAITQPRRVAAISLARRVAEEFGTPLGISSPASQVGYSVRFDNNTSPATRIKFLTEGMLLQEMLRDPWLKDYSAVVVDEVHERGVNVDLVLGFLRQLHEKRMPKDGRGGLPMKVVVMSATADMEKIQHFFNETKSDSRGTNGESVSAVTSDVTKDETTDNWAGFNDDEKTTDANGKISKPSTKVATQFIKGRQYHVEVHYEPAPAADVLDTALQRIMRIHAHSPLPGDVLVFMTGQETVESLLGLLQNYSNSIRKDPKLDKQLPQLLLLPLYAALPTHIQQRVFEPTPKFTRKIIIATNIAETSITVPGIRHVIDSGKSKRRLFRPSLNLESLLTTAISRSSAKQRSGRAGRDAPGHAYRLYTERDFYELTADTEPEILRCDLSQLVLSLKSHGVDGIATFPLLSPPPRRALERALIHLVQLSALSPTNGQITSLGRKMSILPLPAPLARILLASTETYYNCVEEIIDIVSALSVENVFLNIHQQSSNVPSSNGKTSKNYNDNDDEDPTPNDPRLQLRAQFTRREGDHLTLLSTVQAYVNENTDRKRWCEERGISHRAMQAVIDVRKQLTALMLKQQQVSSHKKKKSSASSEDASDPTKSNTTTNGDPISTAPTLPPSDTADLTIRILKCLLTGLHPNVARLSLSPTSTHKSSSSSSTSSSNSSLAQAAFGAVYTTLHSNQPVQIHPSSVLFGRKIEAIMYSEFVYTNRTYARGVSVVELGWVLDAVRRIEAGDVN